MSTSSHRSTFQGIRISIETSATFDEVLQRLRDVTKAVSVPHLVALAKETVSEEDYIKQVRQKFVGTSDFMLFSEIDHGGWIGRFGIHRRLLRWILGNPLIAITMIRQDLSAGLFVPIELLLTESEDGQRATLTYVLPSSLIAIETGSSPLRKGFSKLLNPGSSPAIS